MSISLFLYFILLFITGATGPLPVLPEVISDISRYIPFTYNVLLLQNIWLQRWDNVWLNILVTLSVTIICFSVAVKTFRWNKK